MNRRAIHRARTHRLVILFVALSLGRVLSAAAQTWRPMGPPGGDVRALAGDPQKPSQIYLGTTDGHIFGSSDAGEHWQLLGRASDRLDAVVAALLVDPRDSQTLYAGTWARDSAAGGGIFKSEDGGHTWAAAGLRGQAVRALAQARSDPNRIIAGTLEGIFGSRDAGRTWERLSPESNEELRNLDSLAMDPRRPEILYAGTFHLPWKSSDGGKTWAPIHTGMIDDSDVMSILVDLGNPDRIYASACSGIYRSDNGAAVWQKIQGIPYTARRTYAIAQDPAHPETIYAGTSEGLWKSTNAGAAWKRLTPGDWVINALALPAEHPGRVVLGTEGLGVVVSDDGGANFREANGGFDHRQIAAVALDPEKPGRVLTVLSNAREPILATDDAGQTWKTLGPGLATRQIRQLYASPDGWWAALGGGGLMQYDARRGLWARAGIITGAATAIADGPTKSHGKAPGRKNAPSADRPLAWTVNAMAFSQTRWFAATEHGLLVSDDGGARWQLLPLGPLPDLPVASVGVSRDAGSLWVVSLRGLVFSSDGGHTWAWHDLPIRSGGALRLESVPGTQTFVAIAHNGLFVSRDSGASWEEAAAGLPELPVEDITLAGSVWVVSFRLGGLYISRNAGRSWNRIPGILADGQFPAVVAQSDERSLLAASASDGLYSVELPSTGSIDITSTSQRLGQ